MGVGFADDGQGVDVCGRLGKGEDFESRVGLAVAVVVAAVGVGGSRVAAVHRYAVVVNVWTGLVLQHSSVMSKYLDSGVGSCQTSMWHLYMCLDATAP